MTACTPLLETPPVLPVVSSGQWGGQAPETYRRVPTTDLLYLAGAAVMAHPGGPAGGVRALQQCWEAAVQNIPLADYARTRPELAQTLEKFGKKD
jgi:ribulose-bisphosphate carboxylase large chain